MMNEVCVKTWNELQDALFQDAWRPEINRFRSHYAFRGLSDAAYTLDTTLIRLGGDFQARERDLLRNFRKYAHRNLVRPDSAWHWLSLAQHHGLPTRLLDWTFSPFVAMHFATVNTDKACLDGAIWAVDYVKAHELVPDKLKSELDQEGSDLFTTEMLSQVIESLSDFDELAPPDFAVFFEPPSIDDRIVNQYALFSVVSNPALTFQDWLEDHPDLYFKIIIPADLKWEIRDKLDQANITERVLFPGLDGLSSWLRRLYSPKT